jgi:hypothetical protein
VESSEGDAWDKQQLYVIFNLRYGRSGAEISKRDFSSTLAVDPNREQ